MFNNAINRLGRAFQRVLTKEHAIDTVLGVPAPDDAARLRRINAMSAMTSGNGFRTPPKAIRKFADSTTRGQRKRAASAVAMAKVSEARAPEFMHSAARRRLGDAPRPMTGFPMQEAA